jgi:hypothetical protein
MARSSLNRTSRQCNSCHAPPANRRRHDLSHMR